MKSTNNNAPAPLKIQHLKWLRTQYANMDLTINAPKLQLKKGEVEKQSINQIQAS